MIQKIRMDMSIGSNIQKRRYQCKLKQDQVIAKMNLMGIPISKSSYAKIETNRMNIKVSELVALAKILDCEGRRLFQRFKIKFHLSFVVIFSLPVVQIALRFFYFKQKYSLSLRIHTWAHGNASVSESLSFTENVPYVEAHAQINCVRRCGNRSNR